MSKTAKSKRLLSDSIIFNVIGISVAGILLLVITLLFLNIYTRHGQNVVVPDLKGLQATQAESLLNSKGLTVQVIDSLFKSDAVPGSIVDQTPKPDNKVKEGRSIYVTIYSYNPQQISIPDLVDFSSRQALSLLNSIGFNDVEIIEVPAQYSGIVISVEYKGRKLNPDELVPMGHPLRLVIGRNMDIDSLNMDQDYIIAPDVQHGPNNNNSGSSNNNMDDAFF